MVFASLLGSLGFTSALLLFLAPAPLTADASSSLFAIGAPRSMDVIFDTAAPLQQGRWKYLFIHHSQTAGGNALTVSESLGGLPDHFVIGNGDGCKDGELQIGQRWAEQSAPGIMPGLDGISPDCISICLIGDFNRTRPTDTQGRRLAQLVNTLQGRLGIRPDHVIMLAANTSQAGIGKYFPTGDFRVQLLP